MSKWNVFLIAGLLLVGFLPNAMSQASVAYSISYSDGQLSVDVRPDGNDTANATDCTELTVSNEGQETIDVDGVISGASLEISPSNFSVTLQSGESISIPVCVTAAIGISYRNVQVTTLASGRDQNGNNAVNKNAGFAVTIEQYSALAIQPGQEFVEICQGSKTVVTFTAVNNGNYQDTIAVEILNQTDLEDAGFVVALAAQQYLIDYHGEQPVPVSIDTANTTIGMQEYLLTMKVSTTLEGESTASSNTTILKVIYCREGEVRTSSLSFLAVVTTIVIASILRRP